MARIAWEGKWEQTRFIQDWLHPPRASDHGKVSWRFKKGDFKRALSRGEWATGEVLVQLDSKTLCRGGSPARKPQPRAISESNMALNGKVSVAKNGCDPLKARNMSD